MNPDTSARNLTPSSPDPGSLAIGPAVVDSVQMLHGHPEACVVKDQTNGAAIGLPSESVTPDTVAVYTAPFASQAAGVSVPVHVAGS